MARRTVRHLSVCLDLTVSRIEVILNLMVGWTLLNQNLLDTSFLEYNANVIVLSKSLCGTRHTSTNTLAFVLIAGVPSNLLIQFVDDNIDQTPQLASTLDAASVTTSSIIGKSQVTVRMLPGDHVRPLRQAFGDLPPELAQVANQAVTQGSYFLQGLSNMATQAGFAEVRLMNGFAECMHAHTS